MGYCAFAFLIIYHPFDDGVTFSADWRINSALGRLDFSARDGKVFPMNGSFCHHGRKDTCAQHVFGNDSQSGGVSVQTIDTAENKGLSLFVIVPGQCICQRIIIIVQGRVDGHVRRLVYHQNVLILIYNVQWQFHRRNLF